MAAPAASQAQSRRLPLLGASYSVGARIVRALPQGLRYGAAGYGGGAWYWLNGGQRKAALDNYSAALGLEPSDPEVARVAQRAFQNYGRILIDFVLIGSLTPAELMERMSIDGREHLDASLERGRGVVMVTAHMGSWDMAVAYGGALGYQVAGVTTRFRGSLNDEIVRARQRFGVRVLFAGRAAVRTITQILESNGIVALVCDLEQGPGVDVRFFGRRAVVPGGPAALALKTGAAVLPAYQYAVAPGRQHVHVDPPISPLEGESKEQLMQRIVRRFEDFIRARPEQWYAFRPMFKAELG